MKRLLFVATFFFVGTGTASADYVLLKINLNQFNFLPSGAMANFAGAAGAAGQVGGGPIPGGVGGGVPGGAGGFGGKGPGMAGGFGMGGGGMLPPPPIGGAVGGTSDPNVNPYDKFYPADRNARWVTALVEINNVSKGIQSTPFGALVTCDTRWGKNVWLPVFSPAFPMVGAPRILAKSFTDEFTPEFNKEKKEKNIETMLRLARWTLSRGHMKRFHEVMDEAAKINDKHVNVKQYQRVKKALEAPFKNQDPAQRDLLDELTRTGYKETQSKKGHYGIYAPNLGEDPYAEAAVKRRLNMLEDTLDTFYFWFAVQKELSAQPALPKYRLIAIVAGSKDDFVSRHAQWGSMPRVADGFTPQRDNVIVMSGKPRIDDPNYAELESLITTKLADINTKLQPMGFRTTVTRENLLSGEIRNLKESGNFAIFIGAAQTGVLLAKALEDQAERHTVTNEGVRQLLVASCMFPRSVQVPDWIVEGLAAFFETPAGTAYPTVGDRSCIHLISFKYHRAHGTFGDPVNPAETLQSVISDAYFHKAKQLNKDLVDRRDEKERRRLKESWEVARCTSWSFIYYLAQNRKLDYVFNYGKELNKLPRDMDLSSGVMQGCFAKAFDMAVPNNPLLIEDYKMKNMAAHWFDMMQGANLDNASLQAFLEKERAKQSPDATQVAVAPNPNSPPNPDPQQPPVNLVGTTWTGTEGPKAELKLTIQFTAQGKATVTTPPLGAGQPPIVTPATWTQAGNSVTTTLNNGTTSYTGTVNGNQMQGKMTAGTGTSWDFSVTNGGGAPNPNPPPANNMDLTGTTWGGKESRANHGPLSLQFNANGKVTATNSAGNHQGQYNQQGNNITITFNGNTYTGVITGNTMQGNAVNGATNWNWQIGNGSPAIQGINPNPMQPKQPPVMPPKKKGPFG